MRSLANIHHHNYNELYLDAFIWRNENGKGVQFVADLDCFLRGKPELLPTDLGTIAIIAQESMRWNFGKIRGPALSAVFNFGFGEEDRTRMIRIYNETRQALERAAYL